MPDKVIRNIRLTIEYDGTDYCGWQIQSHHSTASVRSEAKPPRRGPGYQKKSIQEVIEKTLRKILQEKVRLIASGRTDAGVHALAQVANFKTRSQIPLEKLERALNGLLPGDISVYALKEVPSDFHSRFSAKSKLYRYTILNRKHPSPFLKRSVYFYPFPLNVRLMQRESRLLLGRHDFSSFRASGAKVRNPLKHIRKIKVVKQDYFIYIYIEADGFLYNMARNIVGTLIEIGRGKLSEGTLEKILDSRDRRLAGPTAPAKGLCLVRVKY